jgi:uncharacterized protein (DUF952 family)
MDPNLLYKIVPKSKWAAALAAGVFRGCGIDIDDGFIHLSSAQQVAETLAKHFAGQTGLVRLGIDANSLGDSLRWEASRGGALFPHVYGEIPLSAVKSVESLN